MFGCLSTFIQVFCNGSTELIRQTRVIYATPNRGRLANSSCKTGFGRESGRGAIIKQSFAKCPSSVLSVNVLDEGSPSKRIKSESNKMIK